VDAGIKASPESVLSLHQRSIAAWLSARQSSRVATAFSRRQHHLNWLAFVREHSRWSPITLPVIGRKPPLAFAFRLCSGSKKQLFVSRRACGMGDATGRAGRDRSSHGIEARVTCSAEALQTHAARGGIPSRSRDREEVNEHSYTRDDACEAVLGQQDEAAAGGGEEGAPAEEPTEEPFRVEVEASTRPKLEGQALRHALFATLARLFDPRRPQARRAGAQQVQPGD
jgi:hypothetical protein